MTIVNAISGIYMMYSECHKWYIHDVCVDNIKVSNTINTLTITLHAKECCPGQVLFYIQECFYQGGKMIGGSLGCLSSSFRDHEATLLL